MHGRSLDAAVLSAPTGPLVVPCSPANGRVELSVVVPTLDEVANVCRFLPALRDVLDATCAGRYEVIVIDDDSPDGTWRAAAELMTAFPGLRVVRRRRESGLATAVIRGWQMASGEILGTINADFQHPPELIGRLWAAIDGADVAVASRRGAGGGSNFGWHRGLGSQAARALGSVLVPAVFSRVSDPLSGCYLFRRRVIAGVELRPLGYKTLIEVLARGTIGPVRECTYRMARRTEGRSKLGLRHPLSFVAQLLRLRTARRAPG